MILKKINLYLAKNFITRFIQLLLGFSLLIFLINLSEILNKSTLQSVNFFIKSTMAFCLVFEMLNQLCPSIILISAIITFFNLSYRSEITIIRNTGMSLWHITLPISFSAFIIGIFWITLFQPLSIKTSEIYSKIESKYYSALMTSEEKNLKKLTKNKNLEIPRNGVWLRQENLEKPNEELIIFGEGFNKKESKLLNSSIWFFDDQGRFYKKIDSEELIIVGENLILNNNIVNKIFEISNPKKDLDQINLPVSKIILKTNIDKDFLIKKILSKTENINSFSIFEIPYLIEEMEKSGVNPQKFKVKFHSLVNIPALMVAMTLIACYFGINHIRNQKTVAMIILGILIGVAFYITSNILNSIGSSGLISIFTSTWMVSLICLASGILLIYHKEKN